jgi:hyperosmotically inducible protein
VFADAPTRLRLKATLLGERCAQHRDIGRSVQSAQISPANLLRAHLELHSMHPIKTLSAVFATVILMATLGCASTRTHEGTGEYVDDSAITTKVKTAILSEPGLKVSEINVETFKGVVQLSGFVNSQDDIKSAVRVASTVSGVKSVKNDMRLK